MKSFQPDPELKHLASSIYLDTTIGVNPVPGDPQTIFSNGARP